MEYLLTPGQKAARTKRRRYGDQGLSAIAAKAYRARLQRKQERLTQLERHLAQSAGAAKSRARRKGLECEEDLAGWALATMEAQGHLCLLSGVGSPFADQGAILDGGVASPATLLSNDGEGSSAIEDDMRWILAVVPLREPIIVSLEASHHR